MANLRGQCRPCSKSACAMFQKGVYPVPFPGASLPKWMRARVQTDTEIAAVEPFELHCRNGSEPVFKKGANGEEETLLIKCAGIDPAPHFLGGGAHERLQGNGDFTRVFVGCERIALPFDCLPEQRGKLFGVNSRIEPPDIVFVG